MYELQYDDGVDLEIIAAADTIEQLEFEYACYIGQDGYEIAGDDFRCAF